MPGGQRGGFLNFEPFIMKKELTIVAATMLLAACGGKSESKDSKASEADSLVEAVLKSHTTEPAAEETPEAPAPGRGDLGSYDLRGPVKRVDYGEWSAAFNEQGQLTHENGERLENVFPGGVKRDKNGRLKECNADGYGSRYYTYNDRGLPIEINEDGYARQMTYDDEGYLKTEKATVAPEMGDEGGEPEVITSTYTIVEKDSHGNWTKRKDQMGNITTRSITYYK